MKQKSRTNPFETCDPLSGECKKEGEWCIAPGVNLCECCEGLECGGFPIYKCQKPAARNILKQLIIVFMIFYINSSVIITNHQLLIFNIAATEPEICKRPGICRLSMMREKCFITCA